MKASTFLILMALTWSCLNDHYTDNKEINYITSFGIVKDPSPNPDKIVFRIHSASKLKEILLSEKWDSIKFSGGLFDTASYNRELIGIAKTDVQNELIVGMHTLSFFNHTQNEMDSIASETFEKVEVNVYYKSDIWKLKPLGKDKVKH